MKIKTIEPRFLRNVPRQLEAGVLYISMEFGAVVHSCCCGCGLEVVTPLSPSGWKLTYDGEAISLSPSIGNWSFPCKSHYFIKKNKIVRAELFAASIREREALRRSGELFEMDINNPISKSSDSDIKLGERSTAEPISSNVGRWSDPKKVSFWKAIFRLFQ